MCTVCALYVYCMCTVCALYVHCFLRRLSILMRHGYPIMVSDDALRKWNLTRDHLQLILSPPPETLAERGFDPRIFGLWAQHANHCATPLWCLRTFHELIYNMSPIWAPYHGGFPRSLHCSMSSVGRHRVPALLEPPSVQCWGRARRSDGDWGPHRKLWMPSRQWRPVDNIERWGNGGEDTLVRKRSWAPMTCASATRSCSASSVYLPARSTTSLRRHRGARIFATGPEEAVAV